MISIEQIKMLEERVHHVVQRMSALRRENQALQEQLTIATTRATALEGQIAQFADSQAAIEAGILSALQHLDTLEDEAIEAGDAVIVEADEPEEALDDEDPPIGYDPGASADIIGNAPETVAESSTYTADELELQDDDESVDTDAAETDESADSTATTDAHTDASTAAPTPELDIF